MTEGEQRFGERCTIHGAAMSCDMCREIGERLARAEAMYPDDIEQGEGAHRLALLGLTWDDLRGRRVLEIGAGHGELLRYLQHHGIDAVGVDAEVPTRGHVLGPYYAHLALRDAGVPREDIAINLDEPPVELMQFPSAKEEYVPEGFTHASWEALPFVDRTVDVVVGTALGSGITRQEAVREACRVLKSGGIARFHGASGEQGLRMRVEDMGGTWTTAEEARLAVSTEIQHTLGSGWEVEWRTFVGGEDPVLVLRAPDSDITGATA